MEKSESSLPSSLVEAFLHVVFRVSLHLAMTENATWNAKRPRPARTQPHSAYIASCRECTQSASISTPKCQTSGRPMEICRRKKHRTKDGGGEAVASEKHENCGKMWIAKKKINLCKYLSVQRRVWGGVNFTFPIPSQQFSSIEIFFLREFAAYFPVHGWWWCRQLPEWDLSPPELVSRIICACYTETYFPLLLCYPKIVFGWCCRLIRCMSVRFLDGNRQRGNSYPE